jgi:protein-L-isoaspartate O-methyltransferase
MTKTERELMILMAEMVREIYIDMEVQRYARASSSVSEFTERTVSKSHRFNQLIEALQTESTGGG